MGRSVSWKDWQRVSQTGILASTRAVARVSLSLSQQKTLFLQKGLKFKQPQCNVDRSAIKSDNDEERNDEVGGKCVKACLQLHQQSLFVIKLLPRQIKVVLTVQSGQSCLAKHGDAYFSAICWSVQDPIAAPGLYENQEC